MAGTADTRTPGAAGSEYVHSRVPNASEVLSKYGLHPTLELVNQTSGGQITGPVIDIGAQEIADLTGLPVTYLESFRKHRTVRPGDQHVYADVQASRTLKEAWERVSAHSGLLDLRLTFPKGTDPSVAKRATRAVVVREEVTITARTDEVIRIDPITNRPGFRELSSWIRPGPQNRLGLQRGKSR